MILTKMYQKHLFGVFLLFATALLPGKSFAQQGEPLPGGSTINLTFDEDGKIITPPGGFSLKEGEKYNYKITVLKPVKQHAQLIKYFRDKVQNTYQKLNDPTDPVAIIYQQLCTGSGKDFNSFKTQYKDLYDALNTDPVTALANMSAKPADSFGFFNRKDNLIKYLFGDIYKVKFIVDKQTQTITASYAKNAEATFDNVVHSVDHADVEVRVADLQKQFLISYYNDLITPVNNFFKNVPTNQFYEVALKTDLVAVTQIREELVRKIQPGVHKPGFTFCIPNLQRDLQMLRQGYNSNLMIKILDFDWVLFWAWYNDGELKLNPLNFTDQNRLYLPKAYDEKKAKEYDLYITNSMNRMKSPSSDLKISVPQFDTLNRLSGKGKEVYSYEKENAETKKKNLAAAKVFQQVFKLTDSISFRVTDPQAENDLYLKSYNAAEGLKPSKGSLKRAIPLDTHVEVMGYNIKSSQAFTVTPTFIVIEDKSKAIAQLDDAGNTATSLATQALANITAGSTLTGLFKQSSKNVQINLTSPTPKSLSGEQKGTNTFAPGGINYYIILSKSKGKLELQVTDDDKTPFSAEDVTELINQELDKTGIDNCNDKLKDLIYKKIYDNIQAKTIKLNGNIAHMEAARRKILDEISDIATTIASDEITKIKIYEKGIYDELANQYALLSVAGNMINQANVTIPPDKLKMDDDQTPAAYLNTYFSIDDQDAAKKVNLQLTLTNKADNKVLFPKSDFYRTSTAHWVTGSLGFGYVFNAFSRSDVTIKDGVITNTPDEDQFRLIAGLNFYPVPIMLTDSRCIFSLKGRDLASRFSIFTGVSFPKPLYNPHLGISVEPWPGIKLTGGIHFYRRTTYTVVNDQVSNEHNAYNYNGAFASLTIDPVTFIKLIGFIK
jgi:hypothetical protein